MKSLVVGTWQGPGEGGRGEESSGPPHCHQGGGCLWEEDQVAAGTRQNKTLEAAQHQRLVITAK